MNNQDNRKRVCCLYRVSTKKQLEKDSKDDIPMQKQVCHDFADQQGWEIIDEKYEKGVSGFKVSASDRDVIQQLQAEAVDKKFDILLVFMFDRLGRKDDETPFIVEWFVNNGVEVWSATEGEQRFDNHVDKLMNYIRYWQASGESIKTSIRTKTRLGQIVQEGRFRGGTVPYGYRLEKQGRTNKRGHEVYEILVNEEEAAIVKLVFDLYLNHGYGSQRISTYLYERGVMNRQGKNFVNCSIQNFLKNESYTGILKSGDTKSDIFPDLQIIDPDTFQQAQELLKQRSAAYKERNMPLHTKGQGLLSGNLFCAHCGSRLVLTSNTKRNRLADGSQGKQYVRVRYVCYNKTRHKGECDGQTGYTVGRVDAVIDEIVREVLKRAKGSPKDEILDSQYTERICVLKANLNCASAQHKKNQLGLESLKAEMMNVIRGESTLDREMLSEMIGESRAALEASEEELARCTAELEDGKSIYEQLKKSQDMLLSWADIYDKSEQEVKKMIVAKLIRQIRLGRDYKLDIDFNISYREYCQEYVDVVGVSPELMAIGKTV